MNKQASFSLIDFFTSGAIMSLSKHQLLIGWGNFYYVSSEELDVNRPAFYLSDFFLKIDRPWIQFDEWMEISREDFASRLQSIKGSLCSDWILHQPEKFKEAFDELFHLFNTGELEKAVPYLFSHSASWMTPERFQSCLKTSLTFLKRRTGYLYGCWNSSSGILGFTPELLFSHVSEQPKKVQTMALAGTCHSSRSQKLFLESEKEQYEHQLVVEGMRQALKRLGIVHIGTMQLLELPSLTHFITPIELELNQPFDFNLLVHSLHPTPALGTFPLKEGKSWLEKFEKHTPRGYYGAPIGFQYPQKCLSQCFVGIRNVQWSPSGMRIGAGCGVVKKSEFENEWQEIQFKIQAIKDQFDL